MSKKREYNKKTISRLLSYLKKNKLKVFGILVCIIVSSLVSICSSLFLKNLLDDYIKPLLLDENPSFVGLKEMILTMGLIFLIGIIASFISSILANLLSQKILKDIRDEMFRHMQTLPISYFDTRTHGEVMSFYTNDIDAIEQLYSESIIQVTTTIITVLVTLITMLSLSVYMTTIVIITVIFMFMILTKISKKSGII